MSTREPDYWDAVGDREQQGPPHTLWRAYCDGLNTRLLERWLPPGPARLLKTDLYDEALGDGVCPLLERRLSRFVGTDLSGSTARVAARRHSSLCAVQGDVRRLPFADGAFDVVFSDSTLDHFRALSELAASLRELSRVLRPAGTLVLTLDNAANPAIALRNALPFALLNRLGVLPYYVGATCTPRRLHGMLEDAGFEIREVGAIMHYPRLLGVWAARVLERQCGAPVQAAFRGWLTGWERLARWPTRFLTGNYVAVLARRP